LCFRAAKSFSNFSSARRNHEKRRNLTYRMHNPILANES
jgi:hypothetical protein